ncbi:MetQ/NlpA family ABC transporter substrate-binding protein [Desulfobacula sp.]|uniref:ABC transporter substrate-binding protein n=1 Tax=Desulfobacula sp. TaxID=2593537 RepID=UPI002618A34F|nr:MetQ/NlpA family ABC transporter substrate-binding protein [Desulfobacula sp.]
MKKIKQMTVAVLLSASMVLAAAGVSLADKDQTSTVLTLALLPIPDVLPSFVAEANGYFEEYGITVKMLPVSSGLERDQLMQAGRIDGMLNEMAGTASFNREGAKMKIIASARKPINNSALFRILASPKSSLSSVDDLKGVPIAVSKNTIIEYITDRLLQNSGFTDDQIKTRSVPVLPERMQLLMSGRIQAATLPDPLATSAVSAGAKVLAADLQMPEHSVSVLTFSRASLQTKQQAVALYIKSWMRAAQDLNTNPERYRSLMLKKIRVPENIRQSFLIPSYPVNEVPSQAQWADVIAWMTEKKMITKKIDYASSVSNAFLQ